MIGCDKVDVSVGQYRLKNESQSCIARLVDFDIAILRCPENGDVAIVRVICNCRGLYFRNIVGISQILSIKLYRKLLCII